MYKEDRILYIRLSENGERFWSRNDARLPTNDIVREGEDGKVVYYVRYGSPSQIVLAVSGSTDNIKELVRNSGNYQARVRFKNLQYTSNRESVKYWRINADRTEWQGVGEHPNPFVIDEEELVETITADVLKIEIIKVR